MKEAYGTCISMMVFKVLVVACSNQSTGTLISHVFLVLVCPVKFRSKHYLKRLEEGSANVDGSGNFSFEVLRSALKSAYDLDLINVRQEDLSKFGDITEMEGFIAHKDAHWFAIRNINGRYWNLNSMKERPSTISHFKLATEIAGYQDSGCEKSPILIFVVVNVA